MNPKILSDFRIEFILLLISDKNNLVPDYFQYYKENRDPLTLFF